MTQAYFEGFSAEALQSLLIPGIGERWSAVQEQLHPVLAALVEQLDAAGRVQFGREWPLYEISWKASRYLNRGGGRGEPISEYHFALDRSPRGSGIYVGVSGEEGAILVGLTLWGARKDALRRIWESGRAVWQPLVSAIPEVRFTGARADGETWLDAYLRSDAQYLWAGYLYRWDDPRIATAGFGDVLIQDVLRLLPLNEAIMEEVEELEWGGELLLREQRADYASPPHLPPFETIAERIATSGFAYDDQVLRAYHIALQTKPFVILPGISGTGKTRLTRLYADAVHDIQSALATAERLVDLGAPGATVATPDGATLRNPFRLPLNVAITGTVNVDESTFALSDKLLDRANVIELTEVDLEAFLQVYKAPIDPAAWPVLLEIHGILNEVGQPFGSRTTTEILRYLEHAHEVLAPDRALDLQIKQKILPKIRGEDGPRMRRAFADLLSVLGPPSASDPDRFPESAEKVRRMLQRIEREGYTDFYG